MSAAATLPLRVYTPELPFLAGGGTMGALMRAHDWAATPLGPPEHWPQSLRSSVSTCLNCSFPILLWWGPKLVKIYNDAYAVILGDKHPRALGRPGHEVWPELWPTIGPMLERVVGHGQAAPADDLLLPMHRHGYIEECYFSFSYSPIIDESGDVGGVFCPVIETTTKVIGARRLRTLFDLGALDRAHSKEAAVASCATVLARNGADVPFALIYLVDHDAGLAHLAGAAGLEPGAPASPLHIPLNTPPTPATEWPLGPIPPDGVCISGLSARGFNLPGGAWGQAPEHALMLPVTLPGDAALSAVLIAALNPRKRLDDEYRSFLSLVALQIANRMADAAAFAAERNRAEVLAALDREKTNFFSNVSHEFRTPLTLMLGPLEELLSRPDQLEPVGRFAVEIAHRNGLRLLRLVNTLLEYARVEAGRARATMVPIDLAHHTTELAGTFRGLCERAGLSLTIDCPPLPSLVCVDPDMWEKMVLNLLSNAFKFTFTGAITVALHTAADGRAVELRVQDTGIGIPADEMPRLFERFHRVEGARGRTHEGSGIGLALVQELVRLHGGTIGVDSVPHGGSCFTLTIPLRSGIVNRDDAADRLPAVQSKSHAQAFVGEASRWLPGGSTALPADIVMVPPSLYDAWRRAGDPAKPEQGRHGYVLLADDNNDMRDYVARLLVSAGYEVEATTNGEAALAAARLRAPDLLLSDVTMPGLDGFGLLRALRADQGLCHVPVLLLSARAGEDARIEGLKTGADDYLTKPFTARELLARIGANLSLGRLRRDAAARSHAELEKLVEERTAERDRYWNNSRDLLALFSIDGTLLRANPAWTDVLGWSPEEIVGKNQAALMHAGDVERWRDELTCLATRQGHKTSGLEDRCQHKDGGWRWISWTAAAPGQDLIYAVGRDITADKSAAEALQQAQEQLRQAQKMEAVGQLTGGLAHDFNNLLTGITGSLELLQIRADQGRFAEIDRYVAAAQGAARRAASLTHRLLAFSRQQTLDPKHVDINALVAGMGELIRRTAGPGVGLTITPAADIWTTLVDPGQLENALLNACINARDAMPHGGRITIETANIDVDEDGARHYGVPSGPYVSLQVTDTGTGMPPDIMARAFDPFFTTKPIGQGTGLGLSMVYGFARQSGGNVQLTSQVGQGTALRLLLPRHDGQADAIVDAGQTNPNMRTGRGETVLVVDDEPTVRMLVCEVLSDLGYTPLEAEDGASALAILGSDVRIDLLVTDVGLPGGMNGRQVADAARAARPGLKTLFITGYAETTVLSAGNLQPGMQVLTKPFAMEVLADRIKSLILG